MVLQKRPISAATMRRSPHSRNRMSPTHANKRGVRYRYYVSHAIPGSGSSRSSMRKRPPGSGTIIARIFNIAGFATG